MDAARLTAIPLLATLSPDDLARLAAVATELEIDAGTALTEEGDFGHAMFAIESGTAEVMADGIVVSSVGPGEIVGEVAVLASGRRTATVVATTPMRLIVLFKRDVWKLERDAPDVAERLRELLAVHLETAS